MCRTCGGSVPRQNGKTGLVEARAEAGMIMYNEQVIYTSHMIFLMEIRTSIRYLMRFTKLFLRRPALEMRAIIIAIIMQESIMELTMAII